MFLLIDNYDSFTYNLAQAFMMLGYEPVVLKNDDPAILDLAQRADLEMVCISPGPGHPKDAGLCLQFLDRLKPTVPVLGICLGHQLLAYYAGAKIEIAPVIMHGKQSDISHDCKGMFHNLPNPMQVGRYHSLVCQPTPESEKKFGVTARGPQGEIMALSYRNRPWVGAQFHPESVLTPEGLAFLRNFPDQILPEKKKTTDITEILNCLAAGQDLSQEMAEDGFAALMDGKLSAAQAGAFLMGLRLKGESSLELAQARKAALERCVKVKGLSGKCIDIVGTGGDGKHSFNCSTATALTLAGMGYKVVKHGNRAVSSSCGAADVLEALGFILDNNPDTVLDSLNKNNFAFLFAPFYHPCFKNIGPLRKELGMRTLFNVLGPMINPAQPSHLLMGVAAPELVPLIAEALAHAGIARCAVVCGAGGYDEMTSMGSSRIALVDKGQISWLDFDPAAFGINACVPEDLVVANQSEAKEVLMELLAGNGSKPMQDMMILNTALALLLLEENYTLEQAMSKAREAVQSGIGSKALAYA